MKYYILKIKTFVEDTLHYGPTAGILVCCRRFPHLVLLLIGILFVLNVSKRNNVMLTINDLYTTNVSQINVRNERMTSGNLVSENTNG